MKIYFISIGGVGSGNLAILLKSLGHDVRGSEISQESFYPPMSDLILKAGIHVDFGFDGDKITKEYDLVIIAGAASSLYSRLGPNDQIKRARELGIETIPYAEGIGRFISRKENIDVIGNHGKTTTTGMIAHVLTEIGEDPSYFCGGQILGLPKSINVGMTEYSVCEGDEYPTIPGYLNKGKYMFHKPKHVLLTSAIWDHKNIFKTEEDYINQIGEVFTILPYDGMLCACLSGENVPKIINKFNESGLILYSVYSNGQNESDIESYIKKRLKDIDNKQRNLVREIYIAFDINFQKEITQFKIIEYKILNSEKLVLQRGEVYEDVRTMQLGIIGVENSLATFAVLRGIFSFDQTKIIKALGSFKGVKRKHEFIETKNKKVILINDHAHSPIKILSSISAVRSRYKKDRLIILFHVSQSALKEFRTFLELQDVFNCANYLVILKVFIENIEQDIDFLNKHENEVKKYPLPLTGKSYMNLIRNYLENQLQNELNPHNGILVPENVKYIPDEDEVIKYLEEISCENSVILVLSSGNVDSLLNKIEENF